MAVARHRDHIGGNIAEDGGQNRDDEREAQCLPDRCTIIAVCEQLLPVAELEGGHILGEVDVLVKRIDQNKGHRDHDQRSDEHQCWRQ